MSGYYNYVYDTMIMKNTVHRRKNPPVGANLNYIKYNETVA